MTQFCPNCRQPLGEDGTCVFCGYPHNSTKNDSAGTRSRLQNDQSQTAAPKKEKRELTQEDRNNRFVALFVGGFFLVFVAIVVGIVLLVKMT
jgi:hypothetical protein